MRRAGRAGASEGSEPSPSLVHLDKAPEKINLDDLHAIKHKLDSVAADVVLEAGYVEDHLITNVKIALGLLAILAAAYSHLCPGKFPANAPAVLHAVLAYVALNVLLAIFCYFKEQDAFLVTHPKPGADFGIRLASRMERFSESYTLIIGIADKMLDREIKLETSAADYFHGDGYLAEAKYRKQVARLLAQYEHLDASHTPRPRAYNPKPIPKKL